MGILGGEGFLLGMNTMEPESARTKLLVSLALQTPPPPRNLFIAFE